MRWIRPLPQRFKSDNSKIKPAQTSGATFLHNATKPPSFYLLAESYFNRASDIIAAFLWHPFVESSVSIFFDPILFLPIPFVDPTGT